MSWTLCTSGAAISKAGFNANISGGALAGWSDQAEGVINTITRKDWVTDYSSVKTNFKPILSDVCSDMIAMRIINYDMSGFTSRQEATTMLDVLRDNIVRNIENLKEDKVKKEML